MTLLGRSCSRRLRSLVNHACQIACRSSSNRANRVSSRVALLGVHEAMRTNMAAAAARVTQRRSNAVSIEYTRPPRGDDECDGVKDLKLNPLFSDRNP